MKKTLPLLMLALLTVVLISSLTINSNFLLGSIRSLNLIIKETPSQTINQPSDIVNNEVSVTRQKLTELTIPSPSTVQINDLQPTETSQIVLPNLSVVNINDLQPAEPTNTASPSPSAKQINDSLKPTLSGQVIPNKPIKLALRSKLFKDNKQAQEISAGGSLDLSDVSNYSSDPDVYYNSLPFKIYIGMTMIGYQYTVSLSPTKNNVRVPAFMIKIFESFQQKNGLPLSSVVDAATLFKLDEQVLKREQELAGSLDTYTPVFQNIDPVLAKYIPADYVAWIFSYAIEVLPQNLISHLNGKSYAACILIGQCVGTLEKLDGSTLMYNEFLTTFKGIYIFNANIFGISHNEDLTSFYQHESLAQMSVILHEFAHYLDGSVHPYLLDLNEGLIDTKGYYGISFDLDQHQEFSFCYKRKVTIKDFLTRYGYDGANSHNCIDGYGPPPEDFAQDFTAYVFAGEAFRAAAKQNSVIDQKYKWLKTQVFSGIEYATDLPYGNSYDYFGCANAFDSPINSNDPNAGPFYLTCNNEDFVWDGKIRQLSSSIYTPENLKKIPRFRQYKAPAIKLNSDVMALTQH